MAEHLQLRSGDTDFRIETRDGVILVDGTAVETPPRRAWSVADGDTRWVFLNGEVFEFEVQRPGRRKPAAHHASLSAPMPATVLRINVAPGDTVKRGATLLVLEAMKMELPVRASGDGIVTAISCREGDLVQPGMPLIEMDE
jgi:biotin carboxyl carrier protein